MRKIWNNGWRKPINILPVLEFRVEFLPLQNIQFDNIFLNLQEKNVASILSVL